jgi:Uma2 family endonuclease
MATAVKTARRPSRQKASSPVFRGLAFMFLGENKQIEIPAWVVDHESFRRWAKSGKLPERVMVSYFDGEIWVDLSMEQFIHNRIKTRTGTVLDGVVEEDRLGYYMADRMLLTNASVGLSTEPDGMFFTEVALSAGRIRLVQGKRSLEVEGSPEMVLEIVSESSVEKDISTLMRLYWKAGIQEYWLIDPRGEEVQFDILRRNAKGFVPTRKQAGWVKSVVFGKSFRLTQKIDDKGLPRFRLEVR